MKAFRNAALLVGVSNSWLQEGPRPLQFAGADAASLQPLFGRQFGPDYVFTLKDKEATTANVSGCLDALAKFAQPGSKVVIFISARGYASSMMDDGYVLTYDAAIDKLPRGTQQLGNGISIQTLQRKMTQMQASEKYLLLDLCRDPAESPNIDNLINKKVLEKRHLEAATRQIVLSSSGSRRSFESTNLSHGYYANALAETLRPGVNLQRLFDDLKAKVKEESQTKQIVDRPSPARNDGWDRCLLCKVSQISGPLVASLLMSPSFFQEELPGLSASEVQSLNQAIEDEEKAQRIFVRYGEGNHFSGDPFHQCENTVAQYKSFRLCREEYETAAGRFERAAELRKTISGLSLEENRLLIESLLERARFCRAQVHLLANEPALAEREMLRTADFRFAESHNALGIAYLDQARYADAEEQFKNAIQQAPHWAYPRHNLALAYVEHGNYSAAEKQYMDAIRWTPVGDRREADKNNPCFHGHKVTVSARPYLYYNLAVLLQRLNRLPEAQKQYCLAEESFRLRLAMDTAASGSDADQATLAELRSIASRINLADVNNSLGALFVARGDTLNKKNQARARAQFQEALRNNPELSAASFNVARMDVLASAQDDLKTAKQSYQKVLDLPSCKSAPNELGCRAAQAELDRLPRDTTK